MKHKPFTFGVATSGENFTDRKNETARLLANFRHGINSILISPRRWGKTSLVRKVCELAKSKTLKIVYLDIFSCRDENEFYQMFATSVLKQTSSKIEEWTEYAKTFLSRIQPKILLGADPTTDFSVAFDFVSKPQEVSEILQLPEKIALKKNCRIVICIDEFQQIAEFKDSKNFQKQLRAVWQLQTAVSYCLFGSKKHLMTELFEKKSLPFYKFGDAIYLPKIGTADWCRYICERFEATGKKIEPELAKKICTAVDNHSSYVQQLAWLVWTLTESTATDEHFEAALQSLLDQNTPLFEKLTESLSASQMNFLRAMLDGINKEFSHKHVLERYRLGSSANVATVKKALIKKELIEIENRVAVFTDPILAIWLKKAFSQEF